MAHRPGKRKIIKLNGKTPQSPPQPDPQPTPPRPEPVTQPSPTVQSQLRRADAPMYAPGAFCVCDKPLIIAEREHPFSVEADSRCLHCGRTRGPANARQDALESLFPDEPA
jgi:hypothetical protein